jgi:ATP-dependent Lon protease
VSDDRKGGSGLGRAFVLEPVIRALRDTAREPTPSSVVVFPLYQKPLFPGTLSTTIVQDEAFASHLKAQTEKGNRLVGMFLTKKLPESPGLAPALSVSTLDEIHPIGLLGSVIEIQLAAHLGAKQLYQVVLSGVRRIAATGVVQGPRFSVSCEELKEEPYQKDDRVIRAYCQEILACLREVTSYDRSYGQQIQLLTEQVDSTNPAELADLVAAIVSTREGAQRVLEELDVKKRLGLALTHLKSELETNKIRNKLAKVRHIDAVFCCLNLVCVFRMWRRAFKRRNESIFCASS